MTLVVKKDEAPNPLNVNVLGPDRIMLYPQVPADAIE
jgi:hypothetical protein